MELSVSPDPSWLAAVAQPLGGLGSQDQGAWDGTSVPGMMNQAVVLSNPFGYLYFRRLAQSYKKKRKCP